RFIPSVKKVEQINKIDFINAGGIDFESEETEDFLNDNSIPFGVEDSSFNMEEDILFLESLLRDDPIPPHPIIPNQTKLPIEETNHSLNMGYENFNTNLVTKNVAEASTKNLIPLPNECMVVSENGSQSIELINDNSLDSTIISNPLSNIESNSNESTSNHNTVKSDYFDEFYGPFIPIHILEEERTRREHADYIKRMEMLFTINPQNGSESTEPVNDNSSVFTTISNPLFDNDKINSDEINSHVESNSDESTSNHDIVKFDYLDEFYGPFIPIHILEEERIRREHTDYINRMEMLFTINPHPHPSTNANINSEDSDFDNPPVPLPPPEPPDEEFDFEIHFRNEIPVMRNTIVKFECIDARIVFSDKNDVLSYFMFDKVFSFLSAESEDTIFDHGISN
nr:hypothetical protein [Tanacetum cinerariifolium]